MLLLLSIVALCRDVAGTRDGCTPYIENGTVKYDYFQQIRNADLKWIHDPVTPQNGEYPEGTFAKVRCKITPHGSRRAQEKIFSQCRDRKWHEEDSKTIPECPSRDCAPLRDNDTVRYEYLNISRVNWYKISSYVVPSLENGKYPEGTIAKMFCKDAPDGKKDLDKEIVGTCNKAEWVKERESMVLQCPIQGCLPLPESDTVEYKYFTSKRASNNYEGIAMLDFGGKFALGTFAQRICKKLDKNSRAQDNDFTKCGENGWEHGNKWTCPPPDSCDEFDIIKRLNFQSISSSFENSKEVYSRESSAVTFYASGSRVQAYCKGAYVYLLCKNGNWLGESQQLVTCRADGIKYNNR